MTDIVNDKIKEKEVILIDQDGNNFGLRDISFALSLAEEAGLDLVVMQDKVKPFVCKVMDYKRYLYEQKRREKEQKKKQQVAEIKRIQLSCNIGEADFIRKQKKAAEELQKGNKVVVNLRFHGRENLYNQAGFDVVSRFCEGLSDYGTIIKAPKLDGKNIDAMLEGVKK